MDVHGIVGENLTEDNLSFCQGVGVEQIDTGHGGGHVQAGSGEDRGCEIDTADDGVCVHLWFQGGGIADHDWGSDASVVGGLFTASEISIFGVFGLDPAVVADVEDEGVVRQVFVIEEVQEFAAGLVKPFTHCIVFREGERPGRGDVLLQNRLRWIVGCMGQEGGIPDKEGFVVADGFIDELVDRLHRIPGDGESVITVSATAFGVAVGHSIGESADGEVSLPPLSGLKADILGPAEEGREGGDLLKEADHLLALGEELSTRLARWIVTGDFVLVGKESGREGGQAGSAEAGGDVSASEDQALGGETVNMGCFYHGVAHEAVIVPTLVVGDNQEDVGGFGLEDLPQGKEGAKDHKNRGH